MGLLGAVFGLIGAIAGAVLAGPAGLALGITLSAGVGAAIGSIVGSTIGAMIEQPPKQDNTQFNTGILLNHRSTVAPVPVVYGSRRVGGALVFADTTGDRREFLHLVLVLCEGPIAAIRTVYLDDVPSTDKKYSSLVECYRHLGAESTADPILVSRSSRWSSAHVLNGFAYLYVQLKYDPNVFSGLPVITADVEGRTLYDPRSQATGFSTNPALVVRDYLTHARYGKGVPVGVIQDESFASAATHCEERVRIEGNGASPVPCTVEMGAIQLEVENASLFPVGSLVQFLSDTQLPSPLWQTGLKITGKKENRITLSELKEVPSNPEDPDAPLVLQYVPVTIRARWATDGTVHSVDLPVSGTIMLTQDHSVRCEFVVGQNNALRLASAPPFRNGDGLRLASTGSLPAPLLPDVTYYAIVGDGETFRVAASMANALSGNVLPVTNAGTGTLSVTQYDHPRYTCNGVLNTDASLIDNLNALLTSCRGILVWSAGYYKLLIDQATAPSFAFTPDNITQSWTIDTGDHASRANRINCTWFNLANRWQQDLLTVDVPAFRAADKGFLVEKAVDLPFTADGHMANRICWSILKQLRLGLSVEFTATMEALQVEVGDVVSITHPTPGWSAKLFRVTKLLLQENDEVKVTAREYHPDAYVADTTTTFRSGPGVTLPDPHQVAAPSGITVTESLYTTRPGTGSAKAKATLSWNGNDAYVVAYQVSVRRSAETMWKIIGQTPATTFDWMDVAPGRYGFRVKAINTLGIESDAAETFCEIYGLSAPPSGMTGLTVSGMGGMALLSWDASPDLDVRFGGSVLIQYAPVQSGASWTRSTRASGPIPGNATSTILPLRAGTYMARFVDASGAQSATCAEVVVTPSMVLHYADTSTFSFHPDFYGQKTNCQVDVNALKLTGALLVDDWGDVDMLPDIDFGGGVAEHGGYLPDQIMDFEIVTQKRLISALVTEIYGATDLLDLRLDPIDTWGDMDGQRFSGADAFVEISCTEDDPGGAPVWGGWSRLDVQEVRARAVRVRLTIVSDGFFNVHVSEFSITASRIPS